MLGFKYTVVVKSRDKSNYGEILHIIEVRGFSRCRAIIKATKVLNVKYEECTFDVYSKNEKEILIEKLLKHRRSQNNRNFFNRNFFREIKSIKEDIYINSSHEIREELIKLTISELRELTLKLLYHSYITIRTLNNLNISKSRSVEELKYISTVTYMISDSLHNVPYSIINLTKQTTEQTAREELIEIIINFLALMNAVEEYMYLLDTNNTAGTKLMNCYRFSIYDFLP